MILNCENFETLKKKTLKKLHKIHYSKLFRLKSLKIENPSQINWSVLCPKGIIN